MRFSKAATLVALMALMAFAGCNRSSSGKKKNAAALDPAEPVFATTVFVSEIDNPYFPLAPGTSFVHEGVTSDGMERVESFVSHLTRTVAGVECVVVIARAYLDGDLIEETFDWYAQDTAGNVWYLGEDSREIENGVVVSTDGSWEEGVDGAMPGIIMGADPRPGDNYRQEYYEGKAEDMAEVVALDVVVTLSDNSVFTCLKTKEWNPLEQDSEEYKYSAPCIGLVLESKLDGSEAIELTGVTNP